MDLGCFYDSGPESLAIVKGKENSKVFRTREVFTSYRKIGQIFFGKHGKSLFLGVLAHLLL